MLSGSSTERDTRHAELDSASAVRGPEPGVGSLAVVALAAPPVANARCVRTGCFGPYRSS